MRRYGMPRGMRRLFAGLLQKLLVAVLCMALLSCTPMRGLWIENEPEIAKAVRAGLREHAHDITVTFRTETDASELLQTKAKTLIESALEETENPREGDYIRYQYGGYTVSTVCEPQEGGYRCTLTITPTYYLYHAEEAEASERAAEVLRELDLPSDATDAEKVKAVYDWVCKHVRYDRVHEGNAYHTLRSTIYGGLVYQSATCQGFAVTVYRLLRELGVDCRILTGSGKADSGETVFHAWNIVRLGDLWYLLDATWDAGKDAYDWFLLGTDELTGHDAAQPFADPSFVEQHPMAQHRYTA